MRDTRQQGLFVFILTWMMLVAKAVVRLVTAVMLVLGGFYIGWNTPSVLGIALAILLTFRAMFAVLAAPSDTVLHPRTRFQIIFEAYVDKFWSELLYCLVFLGIGIAARIIYEIL